MYKDHFHNTDLMCLIVELLSFAVEYRYHYKINNIQFTIGSSWYECDIEYDII